MDPNPQRPASPPADPAQESYEFDEPFEDSSTPDDFDFNADFPEYRGEIKPRLPSISALLSWTCPGLAYVYVGEFAAGILVNTSFVLSAALFFILWTRIKFFPLWPGLVLAVSWLLFAALIWRDTLRRIRERTPYILKPVNHPVVYGAVGLLTFWLPLATVWGFASQGLWVQTWSGDETMYPSITAGDLLLIDRTAFKHKPPQRSDLVLVEGDHDDMILGRVIATSGDRVQFENGWPLIGASPLDRYDGGDLSSAHATALPEPWPNAPPGALLRYEVPHRMGSFDDGEPGRWYPILTTSDIERLTPGQIQRSEPTVVPDGFVMLLNDNRTLPMNPDQPQTVGRLVPLDWVVGRPLYVLVSRSPDGSWRWDRSGLRLR